MIEIEKKKIRREILSKKVKENENTIIKEKESQKKNNNEVIKLMEK